MILILLPIDISLPIQATTSPLVGITAFLLVPFMLRKIVVTPLLIAVAFFVVYIFFHSIFFLVYDMTQYQIEPLRFSSWVRQSAALLTGLALYLVFRKVFLSIRYSLLMRSLSIGIVLVLVVSVCTLLWRLMPESIFQQVVIFFRADFLSLPVLTQPYRLAGLSREPAYFAYYITLIALPLVFAFIEYNGKFRWSILFVVIFLIGALCLTFSLTGYILLFSMLMLGCILGPSRRNLLRVLLLGICSLALVFFIVPGNYAQKSIDLFFTGYFEKSESSADRLASLSPFYAIFSSPIVLGYGLGSTPFHFYDIVPEPIAEIVTKFQWKEYPSFGSLVARLFTETGIIGLLFFFAIGSIAYYEILRIQRSPYNDRCPTARFFHLALIGTGIAYTTSIGSFAFPYLWFWLGLIDAHYIQISVSGINSPYDHS